MDPASYSNYWLGQPQYALPSTSASSLPPSYSAYKHSESNPTMGSEQVLDEKRGPPPSSSQGRRTFSYPIQPCSSSIPSHYAYPSSSVLRTRSSYQRPRGLRIANLIKPWIPIILYALTTLGFLVAVAFWKAEVFEGLDELSKWLKSDEYTGYAAIFFLIFLTTIPPMPLYSTLIILSGYTFGPWTGAIISYFASLAGALCVFIISRTFFRASISHWLSCTMTIKRVVKAIEKRPKLLFLIRLAPYPFNVMNCLLAASPSLTLRTYTICTALSLFKLIIHTTMGSSIHSFAQYHVVKDPNQEPESMLGHYTTVIGIFLCIAIFIYLSYVARRAVDDELEDDVCPPANSEETMAFLSHDESTLDMEEVPDIRPASRADDRFVNAPREEEMIGL